MKALKILAGTAAAFSLFASVAMADTSSTTRTSSDFTDLATVNASLKAQINELLAKGVFEGTAAGTFGINETMTRAQFAKVLALTYGIKIDMNETASSFADVRASDAANGWSVPFIEAAKNAGLIDGVTETTFAPGEKVTIGEFATALLRGLGKAVDTSGAPWYGNALQEAKSLKLLPANADGGRAAARVDLVTGAYAAAHAYRQAPAPVQLSMLDAKAADARNVKVTFDREVDSSKATLSLKQGTAVIATRTVWATDHKSATLTLASGSLETGDYTVSIEGINTGIVKIGTAPFRYDSGSNTVNGGSIDYTANGTYVLANVVDSGLTGLAGQGLSVSKTDAEDPVKSKFAKEIVITAKTSAGDSVALPGIVQSMVSSNPSVVKTGVDANHKGYVLGLKEGAAQVTLLIAAGNSETKPITVNVTVKSDSVAVDKLEAGLTTATPALSVSGSVYSFNAYDAMNLKATDNYGITYEDSKVAAYNFALGIQYTTDHIESDATKGAAGTVTVDANGKVEIVDNVAGFNLNAISTSGKKATTYIVVSK